MIRLPRGSLKWRDDWIVLSVTSLYVQCPTTRGRGMYATRRTCRGVKEHRATCSRVRWHVNVGGVPGAGRNNCRAERMDVSRKGGFLSDQPGRKCDEHSGCDTGRPTDRRKDYSALMALETRSGCSVQKELNRVRLLKCRRERG